ncbi:hypothetical protein [Streptomyces sp. NPDC006267]|uniref:hypothetical protein n=1 Tax=Streptomyces sp. NPDC006267 TaxID=3157173 RepID=UPI0033BD4DA4
MDTYSHAYGYTGHYRRPGTQTSYCGRDLLPEPNTGIATRICATCTKGEQRDRVAAEQTVADRDLNGPTLAVRAGVRYCLVGTGRRVHYSNNDDTLCGREVTEYTDGLDERHDLLCAPCIKAAEKRAYARALADASPLAKTAGQTVAEQAPAAVRDEPSDWWTIMDPATGEEIARVHGETYQDMTPRAEALPEVRAVIRKHKGFSRRRLYVSELTPEQLTEQAETEAVAQLDRTARAVEYAEQAEAAVETVEDAEALYAAALVTEAEASDHTWRGAWIGEQPAEAALFVVDGMVEQGALFAPGVDDCRVVREPIVARASFLPTDLDRIKTKADADRAKYRAETDDRIAAECAAHGVAPSQGVRDRIAARAAAEAPAHRVIEGVVVTHNGTAQGSTPADATHPNVTAARAALDGLAVATMTDHHDVTEPTEDEQRVRGYLIDPREGDRVAVYWLEAGRIIRRDTPWHGPALDCLADRLTRRGWTVEPMLKSSQCVFAHRPPAN